MREAVSEEKSRMSPATLLTHEWGRGTEFVIQCSASRACRLARVAILFARSSQRSAKSNKCAFPAEVGACRARRSVCAAFFLYSCARRMGPVCLFLTWNKAGTRLRFHRGEKNLRFQAPRNRSPQRRLEPGALQR